MTRLMTAMAVLVMACGQGLEGDASEDFSSKTDALTAADVRLTLSGANSVAQNGTYRITYSAGNRGQTYATAVTVDFVVPAGATLLASSNNRCALNGNGVRCTVGGMGFNRTITSTVDFAMATAGAANFSAQAVTPTQESNYLNNLASLSTIVVAAGPIVAAIPATGGVLHIASCNGTVSSFAQCVPSSLVEGDVLMLSGGVLDLGGGGYTSTWGQNSGQTDFSMQWFNNNVLESQATGVAVSTTCFEGLWRTGAGVVYGAFRACF